MFHYIRLPKNSSIFSLDLYHFCFCFDSTKEDFPKMYAQLAAQKHISVSQAEQWVKQNGLTPHHLSCDEIMLVPTALHENIAHTGAASMLRNGTCR